MSSRHLRHRLVPVFLAFALLSLGMATASHTVAGAGAIRTIDITDHEQDYSDPVYSEGYLDPLPEQADAWCNATYTPAPAATWTFSQITRGSVTTVLKVDEYDPPTGYSGPFAAAIYVHGGGFARGCRKSMASVAWSFANNGTLDKHFIGLAIDYRMACDPTDPSLGGIVAAQKLCNWTFKDQDPIHGNTTGSAIHDVQDAVVWARTLWPHPTSWNGAIAVMGGSGGGNLVQLASIQWSNTQVNGPDALAGWSPFPRFTKYVPTVPPPPTTWTCDVNQSAHPDVCSIGYAEQQGSTLEGGINRYIPCQDPNSNAYQSGCEATGYNVAAPYDVVTSTTLPKPSFLANGGGPDGVTNPEDSALQPVQNYATLVSGFNGTVEVCIVDLPDHGVRLLNDTCEADPGHTVRQRTDTFLVAYVCKAPFICGG